MIAAGVLRRLSRAFVALGLFIHAPAAAQERRVVSVCSRERFGPDFVVGVALSDTAAVDTGTAFPVLLARSGVLRHGQKFLIRRSSMPLPSDTAVLVQWRATPDSPPLLPRGTSMWMRPGAELFVQGTLRDREHWARGLPTFDVVGAYAGPAAPGALDPDSVMTPQERFDFCSLQVDLTLLEEGAWPPQIEPIAWARRSNGAWRKYPARFTVTLWVRLAEDAWLTRLSPDVGGTWAVTVSLASGTERTFFMRTSGRIARSWRRPDVSAQADTGPPWEATPDGYQLRFWVANRREDLPDAPGPSDVPCGEPPSPFSRPDVVRDSSCMAVMSPWGIGFATDPEGSRRGDWPIGALDELFRGDAEVEQIWRQRSAALRARIFQPGGESAPLGVFSDSGGALRFEQIDRVAPDQVIRLEAVRVGPDVVDPSPR